MPQVFNANATVANRADFGRWCFGRNLHSFVEVGTDRGIFIEDFIKSYYAAQARSVSADKLQAPSVVCIDPYLPYPEMPWPRDADYQFAIAKLCRFRNARLLRCTSRDFLQYIAQCDDLSWKEFRPEFVYIDADHRYESVRNDIHDWWDRVSPIGVLAGHDYDPDHPGVMRAVAEFADRVQRSVHVVNEDDGPASWFITK